MWTRREDKAGPNGDADAIPSAAAGRGVAHVNTSVVVETPKALRRGARTLDLGNAPILRHFPVNFIADPALRSVLFLAPQDGVCAAEAALAYAFRYAELTGEQPLVVDLDMHERIVSRALGVDGKPGFADLDIASQNEPIGTDVGPIRILPAGSKGKLSASAGEVEFFRHIQRKLMSQFPLVIWAGGNPDTCEELLAYAATTDGVILAVQANATRIDVARHIRDRLRDTGSNLLGAILCGRKYSIPNWLYRWL